MGIDKIKSMKILDALTEFLGNNEGQKTEEIKEELRNEEMDVDATLARLKEAQKSIDMAARRSVLDKAREKRLNLVEKNREFIGKFRGWPRDKIIARIREMSGLDGLEVGVAYRDLDSMGNEEIESILEDLEIAHHRRKLEEGDDVE